MTHTLFVEVQSPQAMTLRDPTPEELAEATARRERLSSLREAWRNIEKEIDSLEKSCPHTVCEDLEGFYYDRRQCFGCGKWRGDV